MIKVICIFGTRPEAIKMAPVIKKLKQYPKYFKVIICVTAQHRDMLDQVLTLFEINPDIDLNLMQKNQTLHSLTARGLESLSQILNKIKPKLVLVQGDTTTAMIAALAAFYQKIPIGHIEAGLRTNNIYNPFPEEVNRRLISVLATFNFAPTKNAVDFLKKEGVKQKNIFLTKNTVVDAQQIIIDKAIKPQIRSFLSGRRFILVTAHRRESFGKPLRNICDALKEIIKRNPNVEIIYPVHLNPNVKNVVYNKLKDSERIKLIQPVEYGELTYLLRNSYFVLTDSGGLQEEAPTFGKPVLIMRETTERPEGVNAGVAKIVGIETQTIVNEACILLNDVSAYKKMSKAINPYGDGKASERIVKIILHAFGYH